MFNFARPCLKLAAGYCRHRSALLHPPVNYGYPRIRPPSSVMRCISSKEIKDNVRAYATYLVSFSILFGGLSFLAVPLYRAFCQRTGMGGVVQRGHNVERLADMEPVRNRPLTVEFIADKGAIMKWNFQPMQREIKIVPGETALAFYRARNPTDKPIIGVSTYNVLPFEAGLYFNKIQCFCFEEQRLNPGEEIDMPVFFYVDPDIMENPRLATADRIVLSYTFFEAQEEEVDKFLEILEKERNDDLEKARRMQEEKSKPKIDPKQRSVSMRMLERARPGLSQHPAAKSMAIQADTDNSKADTDKSK